MVATTSAAVSPKPNIIPDLVTVSLLTLGQYLRPTKYHVAMERFVTPEEFHRFEEIGFDLGFKEVVASFSTNLNFSRG